MNTVSAYSVKACGTVKNSIVRKVLRAEATLWYFVKKIQHMCEKMTCAQGLTVQDRCQDNSKTETDMFANPSKMRPRP